MPAAQPARGEVQQGLRLLLRAFGRRRLLLGRGCAPQAHRPGGRSRREADGDLPREGRSHPRGAARALGARLARGAPHTCGVYLGEDRRRRRRAARGDREAASQSDHILHDSASDAHVHARPLELPTPVFGLAVQPKKHGDEQKVSDVLHKIIAEDPCFRIEHNAQANETVMRGLGEMHLKTVLDKMAVQYKLELDTRLPAIPYRETIAARADGHNRHKKQTGGAGQFGEVFLKVEPLARGKGFEFVDSVKGGSIPNQFIPAVEKGVRGVLASGYVAGYPLQDVRVTVYDGKHHPVDSNEVAFISAGRKAFINALAKARPIIL